MPYLTRTILLFLAMCVLSCSSIEPQPIEPQPICNNTIRRWSFGDEPKYKGQVRSVLLSEQVHVFESHFIYTHDKPIPKTLFEFDRSGRLLKETDHLIDGKPMAPTEYVYDENGILLREYTISGINGRPTLPTTYSYDEDGTIREIRQTGDDGVVYSVWTFENYPNSNYSEFVETKTDGKFEMKIGILRDERCRISTLYHFPYFGLWLGKAAINYDENDNPISVVSSAPLGILRERRKYEYEFDEFGNWIKRSDYAWEKNEDGNSDWKLMNERYRKIDYYDTE